MAVSWSDGELLRLSVVSGNRIREEGWLPCVTFWFGTGMVTRRVARLLGVLKAARSGLSVADLWSEACEEVGLLEGGDFGVWRSPRAIRVVGASSLCSIGSKRL